MTKTIVKFYNFITTKRVLIALGVIVGIAFILRVVFPMRIVFGDGYVNFLEGDAYSRMWYAKQIQDMPFISGFTFAVPRGLLFPWIVAMLGNIFPIELVGAWLPPIIAGGVIVVVYLIGKEIFNPLVGLAAALFVGIIPSEFYHRTLLGYPDHHAMEVLLMALAVYLVIKVIRSKGLLNRYSVSLGFVLAIYLATWTGGIILTGIIGLMALILLVRKTTRITAWSLSIAIVLGNVMYLAAGGFVRYFWWLPGELTGNTPGAVSEAHASSMLSEMIATIFTPLSQRTTSELMPLLAPAGQLHLGVVFTNLHLFTITFIVGLVFLWRWKKDKANLFIILWTIIILIMTLNERRYLYYLTLPVGLLSAWGIYELGQMAKKHAYTVMFLITLALIMISMPILALIGTTRAFIMTPEWNNTLVWLKDEPGDGMVTAWSDYGHWIQYRTDKTPNLFPGPGGQEVAQLMLTADDEEAQALMDSLGTQYLIVARADMDWKLPAVEIVADRQAIKNSLAIRLLNGGTVPYLTLVYETVGIKVYEVVE